MDLLCFYFLFNLGSLSVISANDVIVCKALTNKDNKQENNEDSITFLFDFNEKKEQIRVRSEHGEIGNKGDKGVAGIPSQKGYKGNTMQLNKTQINELKAMIKGKTINFNLGL